MELASHGRGDRLAERGLAHAGRADEAEDGTLDVGLHLLDREVLEDAVLDLLEAVVVGVEDVLGLLDVELHLGALVPGQAHQPVDVGAGDRVFGRGLRHAGEAIEFADRLLLRFLGHLGLLDLLAKLRDLALLIVAVAQFLLDGLHLLAQVVLALVLLQLGLDLALDLVADLQHLEVLDQEAIHSLETLVHGEHLEQLLALGAGERGQAAGHEVGERDGSGCWSEPPCSSARRAGSGRGRPRSGTWRARPGPGPSPRSPCRALSMSLSTSIRALM